MKKQFNNILVCGSIVYDRIMDFPGKFSDHILPDKVHILNVSFTLNRLKESFGGTGGNIAYNLALLNEQPKLLGVAGSDFKKYADWLKANKVDIGNVKIDKSETTASCYIMTDRADNQIAGFYGGPKTPLISLQVVQGLSFRALARNRFNVKNAKYKGFLPSVEMTKQNTLAIVSPDSVARMIGYVKMFKRLKVPYIFDPGQQITSLKVEELKLAIRGAKVLIGNDYEIELILNKLKVKRPELKKMVEILVITKGAKGSEIYYQQKKIIIPPAKAKEVLDPTGAGDAYRAGFLKGLVLDWPLEKIGRFASLVAVYTVEKYGTQTHSFSWKELEKRYKDNYRGKL